MILLQSVLIVQTKVAFPATYPSNFATNRAAIATKGVIRVIQPISAVVAWLLDFDGGKTGLRGKRGLVRGHPSADGGGGGAYLFHQTQETKSITNHSSIKVLVMKKAIFCLTFISIFSVQQYKSFANGNCTFSSGTTSYEYCCSTPFATNYHESLLRQYCNETAKLIAAFAHPTSTYVEHETTVYENAAYLTIRTVSGNKYYDMQVKISINYLGIIGNIEVVKDDDWWPAFAATTMIKSWVDNEIRKSSDDDVKKAETLMEQLLNKTYYQWDGRDLCHFVLNVIWLDSDYSSNW